MVATMPLVLADTMMLTYCRCHLSHGSTSLARETVPTLNLSRTGLVPQMWSIETRCSSLEAGSRTLPLLIAIRRIRRGNIIVSHVLHTRAEIKIDSPHSESWIQWREERTLG